MTDLHAWLLAHISELENGIYQHGGMPAALRAVVELHEPVDRGGLLFCEGCDAGSARGAYDEEPPTAPCTTIATIARELGVEP